MTIDITPTWHGLLPILLTIYTEGETAESRKTAYEELQRMAQAADLYNKIVKESEEPQSVSALAINKE